MKKTIIMIIGILLILSGIFIIVYEKKEDPNKKNPKEDPIVLTGDFDYNIIKQIDKKYNKNYLISPLSIGYALSILNDGADGNTKEQIKKYLNDFKTLNNVNVKNKISISNALFIKNDYKNDIRKEYVNNTKKNYDADIVYDEFKTPDTDNN